MAYEWHEDATTRSTSAHSGAFQVMNTPMLTLGKEEQPPRRKCVVSPSREHTLASPRNLCTVQARSAIEKDVNQPGIIGPPWAS